ncbi:SfnB family sulfur acquisition oxidoreductase [Amycolatopsis sp. NPDC004169]|uniref:SfnB family sulfur acquisition oxidoreductase n=1 Tax=Amycolatopsis sp. NPDC004169 TaxID=3154453 RepID=UPI0033B8FC52
MVATISSADEAIRTAAALSAHFAEGAAERDARRQLPRAELDALTASGLLAITVPAEHGGADLPWTAVLEVFRLLAAGDSNIAHIPQNHFAYVNVLRDRGDADQRKFFFAEVLAGRRFGNAQSERGTRHAQDYQTRLRRDGGWFVLDGVKHYATGALFAHWIPVLAKDEDDRLVVAFIPSDAPGLRVLDDWDGMGQRTTASGTVELTGVMVPPEHVVPHHLTFTGPQLHGARAQAIHAAIDVGIARAALDETAEFVRRHSRPWAEARVERATDDPLTIQRFGELEVQVRAAESLLRTAGTALDDAAGELTDSSAAAASIAVATAKAFAEPTALAAGSAVFELSGTRAAAEGLNLHRHWRNARTHTLHDPVRWKVQHIGQYALNGTAPPRHGLI